jgi:hypothetical protein
LEIFSNAPFLILPSDEHLLYIERVSNYQTHIPCRRKCLYCSGPLCGAVQASPAWRGLVIPLHKPQFLTAPLILIMYVSGDLRVLDARHRLFLIQLQSLNNFQNKRIGHYLPLKPVRACNGVEVSEDGEIDSTKISLKIYQTAAASMSQRLLRRDNTEGSYSRDVRFEPQLGQLLSGMWRFTIFTSVLPVNYRIKSLLSHGYCLPNTFQLILQHLPQPKSKSKSRYY